MGLWIAIGAIALIVFAIIAMYNGMVRKKIQIDNAWSDISVFLKKRFDLIPNLVNTVKGYAAHESQTLEKVVQARNAAVAAPSADVAAVASANQGLTGALRGLLAIAENYPDLKANQNFLDLQSQLEGTENRISVSRKRFNDAVGSYNRAIVGFPRSLIANIGGYTEKGYFKAEEGAEKAPEVKF